MIKVLDKMYGKVSEGRQIQSIQPDHRTGPVFTVVMIVPRRSEDDIAALHADTSAMNGREAAGSFDDEPHGEGCVAVGAGDFVGHD